MTRGRKPEVVHLTTHDVQILETIASSQRKPWYQVRRARIVLGIARGQRVGVLAAQMHCAPSTVRRACRLYTEAGLDGLWAVAPRSGRPATLSPCAEGADRSIGVP